MQGIAFDLGGVSRGIAGYRGVSPTFWRGVGCGAGVSPWQKPYISIWFRRTVCARGRARHYQVRVSRWNRLILYNIKSAAARPSAEPDAIVEFYARVPCRILRRRRARRAARTGEKARGVKAPRAPLCYKYYQNNTKLNTHPTGQSGAYCDFIFDIQGCPCIFVYFVASSPARSGPRLAPHRARWSNPWAA